MGPKWRALPRLLQADFFEGLGRQDLEAERETGESGGQRGRSTQVKTTSLTLARVEVRFNSQAATRTRSSFWYSDLAAHCFLVRLVSLELTLMRISWSRTAALKERSKRVGDG